MPPQASEHGTTTVIDMSAPGERSRAFDSIRAYPGAGPGPASAAGSGRGSPASGPEIAPRKSFGPGKAPSAIRRLQAGACRPGQRRGAARGRRGAGPPGCSERARAGGDGEADGSGHGSQSGSATFRNGLPPANSAALEAAEATRRTQRRSQRIAPVDEHGGFGRSGSGRSRRGSPPEQGSPLTGGAASPRSGRLSPASSPILLPVPARDLKGGEISFGRRGSFLHWLGVGSRPRQQDEGVVFRRLRVRVSVALLGVILVAAGTFLACFLMASRSENAAAELAATGRISAHVAAIAALAREPYVGDGALGLNGTGCAERVQAAAAAARALFDAIKARPPPPPLPRPAPGRRFCSRRRAGRGAVRGPLTAPRGRAARERRRGLTFALNTYLEASLRTLNRNGLLSGPGRGGAGPALRGLAGRRLVRGRGPAARGGETRGTIGRLRSVIAAVLVVDVFFFALLYLLVFKPMLGRLVGETSRAFQLVAMLPAAALEAHHLWV
eukprot:tig00001373_g8440.t1